VRFDRPAEVGSFYNPETVIQKSNIKGAISPSGAAGKENMFAEILVRSWFSDLGSRRPPQPGGDPGLVSLEALSTDHGGLSVYRALRE